MRAGDHRQAGSLARPTQRLLGRFFLSVQGYEWVRLIHFGLTVSSSVYGGLFYTLIGFHGLHVVGALIWLLVVFVLATTEGDSRKNATSDYRPAACIGRLSLALWPVLYGSGLSYIRYNWLTVKKRYDNF